MKKSLDWSPTMQRAMAAHMANAGTRDPRLSTRVSIVLVGSGSLALWAALWGLTQLIEAWLR
jgi:hypothetical protein